MNGQSGTGVLADDAAGLFAGDTIYSDLDAKQIETIPDEAPHRVVDLAVVAADAEGVHCSGPSPRPSPI